MTRTSCDSINSQESESVAGVGCNYDPDTNMPSHEYTGEALGASLVATAVESESRRFTPDIAQRISISRLNNVRQAEFPPLEGIAPKSRVAEFGCK